MAESGKKTNVVWILVKIAIFAAVIFIAWYLVKSRLAERRRIKQRNGIESLIVSGKCEEVGKAYRAYWKKYPSHKSDGRNAVFECYQERALEAWQYTAKHLKGYKKAIRLYREAREHGDLDARNLRCLCECYIAIGSYKNAQAVIDEGEERDINMKMYVKLLAHAEKKTDN